MKLRVTTPLNAILFIRKCLCRRFIFLFLAAVYLYIYIYIYIYSCLYIYIYIHFIHWKCFLIFHTLSVFYWLFCFADSFTTDDIVYEWKERNTTSPESLEIAQFTLESVSTHQKVSNYVTGTRLVDVLICGGCGLQRATWSIRAVFTLGARALVSEYGTH